MICCVVEYPRYIFRKPAVSSSRWQLRSARKLACASKHGVGRISDGQSGEFDPARAALTAPKAGPCESPGIHENWVKQKPQAERAMHCVGSRTAQSASHAGVPFLAECDEGGGSDAVPLALIDMAGWLDYSLFIAMPMLGPV